MTHTTHEALRELDRVAAEVERDGKPFDMGLFGRPECGTAACLAGWAMADPWFAERGLRRGLGTTCPTFGQINDQTDALEEFFALPCDETDRLFFASRRVTIADQRAVIADLLATVEDKLVN